MTYDWRLTHSQTAPAGGVQRKGMLMNHIAAGSGNDPGDRFPGGALYRLYRDEGLSVKRRRGRKRARGSRTPMPEAAYPNARWSLDFLADSFGVSRKFRILAVIDDCCRENLCLTADTSISGARVARELDALVRIYGKPACIVSPFRDLASQDPAGQRTTAPSSPAAPS